MKSNLLNLLNHTAAISFLSKFCILLFNFFTSFVVIFNFSEINQSIYFTITSLFFIQTFVELGFNSVLLHFVGHSRKNIFIGNNFSSYDFSKNIDLLALAKFSKLWVLCASIILFIVLIFSGLFVLSDFKTHGIFTLWIFIALFFTLSFIIQPIYIFLDAIGMLRSVCYLKLIQNISLNIPLCILIIYQFELISLLISQIISFFVIFLFIFIKFKSLIRKLFFDNLNNIFFDWKRKFLPMQWRIAVSSICGYFIFFSYTPLTFKYIDPIIAGKIGFTFTILAGFRSLVSSILNPYVSKYAFLISRKKYKLLNKFIKKNTYLILYLSFLFFIFYFLLILLIKFYDISIYNKLLDPYLTGLLFIGNFLICLSLPISTYLRSFRVEPLMNLSIVSSLIAISFNIVACIYQSVEIMIYSFLFIQILIIPLIFVKYKNKMQTN